MYHPQDTNNPDDPDTEYIELKNIGGSALNLNLVKFTEGIHFTFPDVSLAAGAYVVVVKDIGAFSSKYGGGLDCIAGVYSGSLDNAGERIRLEDALGNKIHEFEYKDGWRNITDGDGYSLQINNENNPDVNSWAIGDNWSASTYIGGTPGSADTGPRWGDIVINEVLAHQDAYPGDWIELHNTTASPINITGFFLSDDDANLTKYQIPSTTIAANGYVVFTESNHFGPYFALSENGDKVCLTGKRDVYGNLTGFRAKEEFGASERGVAFGRYQKSTGTYNFVAMSSNTPGASFQGAPNAYPKVGPVIISEIMYRPEKFWGDWDAEYIELYNLTSSSVNLYDSNGVAWKFTDGITLEFPLYTSIAPHSYLLVVKNLTAFNAQFPGVSTQKVQWTSGKLNDDGETIELSMPGDIDENGDQKYIRIDRVVYSDGSHPQDFDGVTDPWPAAANGGGYSLTRINYSNYGNDPNNWAAYLPSPGQAGTPPTLPSKPTTPSPANGSTNRPVTQILSWVNGGNATSYNVYFGTNPAPGASEFKTTTTLTTFNPGTLSYNTTYYWRIDAINLAGTTTGDVWNFTTAALPLPQKPITPTPSNGATDQKVTLTLTWVNGGDATSYDVYFGTTPIPGAGEYKTNTTSTSYSVGPLSNSTQYYWRIDAKNAAGTTTGNIWNFTTAVPTLLVNLDASSLTLGSLTTWTNSGTLGGSFNSDGASSTYPTVQTVGGVKAVTFDGGDKLKSTFTSPAIMTGNGNYTVSAIAYNPAIATEECMVNWAHRGGPIGTCAQINYGSSSSYGAVTHWDTPDMGFAGGAPTAGSWHQIAVTFDGVTEKVYVDGVLNNTETKTLNMYSGDYMYIGCAGGNDKWFSGSMASVKIYSYAMTANEIANLAVQMPGWTTLKNDNFESGWGNFTSGGANAKIYTYTSGTNYAHQGTQAADIESINGNLSSFWYTNPIDVNTPGYSQVRVDFWYYAVSMESGEDFWLQYWDGTTWQTIKMYVSGTDFANDQFYHQIAYINKGTGAVKYNFPTDMNIRLRCDASAVDDDVYIDEVTVAAR